MNAKKRILITIVIGVILIIAFYFITGAITKYTGFAISGENGIGACLEKQDIRLYINSENTDEALKNTGLVQYMEYFKIQNCFRNNQPCIENGIAEYPGWIINNKKITGAISEPELAQYSGCSK